MGNKNVQSFNWQDQYRIIQKNFNDGTLIVQKKTQNGQYISYIGRQILINDEETSKNINQFVQRKLNNPNPYITKLQAVYYSEGDAYCGDQNKIYLLFQYPGATLKEEIVCRRFANQPLSQQEAQVILQSGVKAIKFLKEQGHPHNNISSSSMFVDQERQILIGDPWATPPAYNINQNQNGFAYPSPQKILYQNDQILTFDSTKSDLFSLGTVVLQSLNLEHMDVIYQKGFRKVIMQKVEEKIGKVKKQSLRNKLAIILSYQPQKRTQIYQYYESGFSSSQVKKRTAKLIYDRANGKIQKQQQNLKRSNHTLIANLNTNTRPTSLYPSRVTNNHNFNTINSRQTTFNNQIKPVPNVKVNFVNKNVPLNPTPSIPYNSHVPYQINHQYKAYSSQFSQNTQALQNKIEQKPSLYQFKRDDKGNVDLKPITLQDQQSQSVKEGLKTSNSDHRTKQEQVKESKQNHILQKSQMKIQVPPQNQNVNLITMGMNKLKDKTPTQSLELESQQFNNEHRKTISQNSDRGFLQSINDAQQTYSFQDFQTQTPQKRPKKKYNSTIKEVSENSSKQEDFEDSVYVVEQYNLGKYEGLKRNGLRNGRGKLRYNEGSLYEGDWKNNEMHGYGSLYDPNGNLVYEGQWNQSEFHGVGKVYNQDECKLAESYDYTNLQNFEDYWSVYEGELSSDLKHGRGKIRLSNGQVFIGRFNCDVIEGDGQFHALSGQIVYGNWKNNKLVKRL